jgi:hypothetical protein
MKDQHLKMKITFTLTMQRGKGGKNHKYGRWIIDPILQLKEI